MSFLNLGLSQPVLDAVQALGFEMPTPIQAQSIPIMMQGRDLIGSAQTGTGKTAAFALPIHSHLDQPASSPRALIIVPTRELACQVVDSIRSFARIPPPRFNVVSDGCGSVTT